MAASRAQTRTMAASSSTSWRRRASADTWRLAWRPSTSSGPDFSTDPVSERGLICRVISSEPFLCLGLSPKPFHFVESGAFGSLACLGQATLNMGEAPFELGVGAAQSGLRIDLEMACKVYGSEQKVAHLARQRLLRALRDLRFDLRDLLSDLVQDRAHVVPVETDLASLLL